MFGAPEKASAESPVRTETREMIRTTSYLRYFCGWTSRLDGRVMCGRGRVPSCRKGARTTTPSRAHESHDGKTTTWPNLGAVKGEIKRPVEIRLLMTCRADETSCAGRRLVGGLAPVAADRVACRLSRWSVRRPVLVHHCGRGVNTVHTSTVHTCLKIFRRRCGERPRV